MTTDEVLTALRRERARLLAALDAMCDDAVTAWVTEEGGWTTHDVMGHLIHYGGQIAFALGAPMTPPAYVTGVTERLSAQEWNERAVAYYRGVAPAEVRAEFEYVADQLEAMAAKRTDDEMLATDAMPWAGTRPLWQIIGGDTFLHEWPAHAAQIEAARAR